MFHTNSVKVLCLFAWPGWVFLLCMPEYLIITFTSQVFKVDDNTMKESEDLPMGCKTGLTSAGIRLRFREGLAVTDAPPNRCCMASSALAVRLLVVFRKL